MDTQGLRIVRILLATLLMAAGSLVLAAPHASAADGPQVQVELTEISPSVARPGDTVTMSGTVTNLTDDPLHHIQVLMWRDQAPITTADQLQWILESGDNDPPGNPMVNDGNYVDLTRSTASPELPATLEPGATLPFEVTGTIEQLRIPQHDATYLVGAMVKGNAVAANWPQTLGRARTLLPVLADQEGSGDAPVRGSLTSLVLLQSTPSRVGTGEFVDDHLAEEVAPDGRLTALLASASRSKVSWAVDPDLITSLEAMAVGYQVHSGGGGLTAGKGAVDAARWLDDFGQLDRALGYQVPYAQLDLAALAGRPEAEEIVKGAVRAAGRSETTTDLPVLGLTVDGLADPDTLEMLRAVDPSVILLSSLSNPEAGIGRADDIAVLTYAADGFAGGPGPEPTTDLKVRQQMLAAGLVSALADEPVVRLVTTVSDADQDRAAQAGYLQRTSLDKLAAQQPTRGFPAPAIPDDAPLLTAAQLKLGDQVRQDHETFAELLVDPGDTAELADAATARVLSGSWRGRIEGQQEYVDLVRRDTGGVLAGEAVTLGQPVPAILTGSTGSFPLTITNNLDVPVRVGVRVESTNRSRLVVNSIDEIVVQPGERVQVQIAAEPAGNGEVAVVAQLVTASGTPLGEPTTRTVMITQYGTVGWAIAIAAGAAFFLFTALRIRKVRKQRAVEEEAADGPVAALTSSVSTTALEETDPSTSSGVGNPSTSSGDGNPSTGSGDVRGSGDVSRGGDDD